LDKDGAERKRARHLEEAPRRVVVSSATKISVIRLTREASDGTVLEDP
jgi:hypothetical protein